MHENTIVGDIRKYKSRNQYVKSESSTCVWKRGYRGISEQIDSYYENNKGQSNSLSGIQGKRKIW